MASSHYGKTDSLIDKFYHIFLWQSKFGHCSNQHPDPKNRISVQTPVLTQTDLSLLIVELDMTEMKGMILS